LWESAFQAIRLENQGVSVLKPKSEILNRIKIKEEDELRDQLMNDPFFQREILPRFGEEPGASDSYAERLQKLLRTGTELTRASYPGLFELFDRSISILELRIEPRVFKEKSLPRENALVTAHGERAVISFVSGILNTVDRPALIQTIVGHELGHYGFCHTEAGSDSLVCSLEEERINILSKPGKRSRSDAEVLRLADAKEFRPLLELSFLLSQVAELNADRAGLLAKPDLMASIEASMLLAGGAADTYGTYNPREYLTQARELVSTLGSFDVSDLETTHPQGPFRALALEFFSETDLFRELTQQGSGTQRNTEFQKLLPRLVPLQALKPALRGYSRLSRALPSFLAHSVVPPSGAASPDVPAAEAPPSTSPAIEPEQDLADAEWIDAELLEPIGSEASQMSERARAELSWILAARIVRADGKVTASEAQFILRLVRPRALAEEVSEFMAKMTDAEARVHAAERLGQGRDLPTRSKTALIRMMIQAAKCDRKVEDTELRAILEAAAEIGAGNAERELRNVFGSRIDSL